VVAVLTGAVDRAGLDDDDPSCDDDPALDPRADPSPATVVETAPTVVGTTLVMGAAVAPETV
jgi:hypothetical protein